MFEDFSKNKNESKAELFADLLHSVFLNEPLGWNDAIDMEKLNDVRQEILANWSDEKILEYLRDTEHFFDDATRAQAVKDVVRGKIQPAI